MFFTSPLPCSVGDPASYYRRDFEAHAGLRTATLTVSAVGVIEARLNGLVAGDEVLAPGWTSYRHRLPSRRHDVTASVRHGQNVIAAIVAEGWAVGRLGWRGERSHYSHRTAVWFELELVYADRTERISAHDARVGTGGILAASLYDGETFDARREPDGWDLPGFDDSAWATAVPFAWDGADPSGIKHPPVVRAAELRPVSVHRRPDGRHLVDLGQNIAGRLRLRATAPAGTELTVRHAELLHDDELEPETLRTARSEDRWILAGDPAGEEWEPRFTFHGFRYAEIAGYPGELTPDDVTGVVLHSHMRRTGWFATSDPLLNRLHENVVWSMRGNFLSVPTDCPQRDERLGWTGDLHAFAPTAAYLYDVRDVLGSWLEDLAAEQRESGTVPWVVPNILAEESTPTALWSDAAVGVPWILYEAYGDTEALRRAYPSMTAFIDQVEPLLDAHGAWTTGFQYGDWLDPDAPMGDASAGSTDRHLVATAFFFLACRRVAGAAAVLGATDDEARFAALADRVAAGFRARYVSASGRLSSDSVTAYSLAIRFDLLSGPLRVAAGERLAHLVAERGFRIATGFAGTPHVADALTSTGHLEEAYRLVLQTELPSFLYPVTRGATTIWERWDSVREDGSVNPSGMTSLNHYALGAIADWLHRVVGGIAAAEPGYRRVRLAPQPGGGLTRCDAALDTVRGRIEVRWHADRGEMRVEVVVPEGVEAEVVLPRHPEGGILTVGGGSHEWTYRERTVVSDARKGPQR